MRILLIASDTARVSQVRSVLLDEDIDLVVNGRGDEGAQSARGLAFDIVLLDPFLPDISGPDVLSRLRKNEVIAPVVVVSDQVGVEEMSRGFGFGADAYATLPIESQDLVARIYRVLGRARPVPFAISVGEHKLELGERLKINGERVPLSAAEKQIVELLARRRGEVFSTEALRQHLYGGFDEPELGVVNVFVTHARRIMNAATGGYSLIETVWGKGYRLAEPLSDDAGAL